MDADTLIMILEDLNRKHGNFEVNLLYDNGMGCNEEEINSLFTPERRNIMDTVKPGYRTTQFYLCMLTMILGAVVANAGIQEGSVWMTSIGMAVDALTALGYTFARTSAYFDSQVYVIPEEDVEDSEQDINNLSSAVLNIVDRQDKQEADIKKLQKGKSK